MILLFLIGKSIFSLLAKQSGPSNVFFWFSKIVHYLYPKLSMALYQICVLLE